MVRTAVAGMVAALALVQSAPERVYPVRAVDRGDVQLTDGFWRDRVDANRASNQVCNEAPVDISLTDANAVAAALQSGGATAFPAEERLALALIQLFIRTGVPRYYEAARALVDRQDRASAPGARALYLYSAMTDVAALGGEKAYLTEVERIWRDVMSTRFDLTGGEPCIAAGYVAWNSRLFFTTGNTAYLDVLERALYNGVLAGNVAQTIAEVPGYIYAYEGETIFVNLFTGSRARVPLGRGAVTISQSTNYPSDGDVRIRIEPGTPRMFTVGFRNPGWTAERPIPGGVYRYEDGRRLPPPRVEVNGTPFIDIRGRSGFITVMREWKDGDEIRVRFQMPVRRVLPQAGLELAGKAVTERGPLVSVASK